MGSSGMWWWVVVVMVVALGREMVVDGASWCVARSNVNQRVLQTALDYACGAGADCVPIQSSGLCFLPNSLEAHASYAFNSYFQRKSQAPGSCDFSASATVSLTDPSYGSCVYPSSASNAGGGPTPVVTPTPPITNDPNAPPLLPGMSPPVSVDVPGGAAFSPPLFPDSPSADSSKMFQLTPPSIIFLCLFIPILPILFQTI